MKPLLRSWGSYMNQMGSGMFIPQERSLRAVSDASTGCCRTPSGRGGGPRKGRDHHTARTRLAAIVLGAYVEAHVPAHPISMASSEARGAGVSEVCGCGGRGEGWHGSGDVTCGASRARLIGSRAAMWLAAPHPAPLTRRPPQHKTTQHATHRARGTARVRAPTLNVAPRTIRPTSLLSAAVAYETN
ncbi:unnamed protein product [Danaus chrysippus]|uniref:(African queen) hypothetical protein n=1 Tax=Danaus chrysippus TaxID=151541 RepID=A0A8J2QT29_9NEOP|nr:unnamed protein product [Danaus chrysippus]